MMDDDPCDGKRKAEDDRATQKARGSVKEAIGKVSGDAATEAEGRAQKEAVSSGTEPPDDDPEPDTPTDPDPADD